MKRILLPIIALVLIAIIIILLPFATILGIFYIVIGIPVTKYYEHKEMKLRAQMKFVNNSYQPNQTNISKPFIDLSK